MTRLTRLWPSLECAAGMRAATRLWKLLLGTDYNRTKQFVRSRMELALSYPAPNSRRFPYHVVIRGADAIAGVCDETGERIPLKLTDLLIRELDLPALARAVTAALGLVTALEPVKGLTWAVRLGYYVPAAGHRFPAYLSICRRAADFLKVVNGLAAKGEPFLLLAPPAGIMGRSLKCF
jgi:hypothetical protein